MRSLHRFRAPVVVITAFVIAACGHDSRESASAPPDEPSLSPVTVDDASAVISDAMLATSYALYLGLTHQPGSTSVSTPDGRLRLSWSNDADFMSGAGTYTVDLNGFTIPEGDPFADDYYGYVFKGKAVIESEDGSHTKIAFDLTSSHADTTTYPVRLVRLRIGTGDGSDGVTVNGHAFELSDLAAAY